MVCVVNETERTSPRYEKRNSSRRNGNAPEGQTLVKVWACLPTVASGWGRVVTMREAVSWQVVGEIIVAHPLGRSFERAVRGPREVNRHIHVSFAKPGGKRPGILTYSEQIGKSQDWSLPPVAVAASAAALRRARYLLACSRLTSRCRIRFCSIVSSFTTLPSKVLIQLHSELLDVPITLGNFLHIIDHKEIVAAQDGLF